MQQIDLEPHEYKTEPRPGEPFFGPGWPFGAAVLVTILISATVKDASITAHIIGAVIGAVAGGVLQQFYR